MHTPGPWTVEAVMSEAMHDICVGYEVPGQGCPIMIASVYGDEDRHQFPTKTATNANARLIAAAPDLLAACIRARDQLIALMRALGEATQPDDVATTNQLEDAIAKATGKTV